jgi:glycosyltransferase involved in cell wall biosynthesis
MRPGTVPQTKVLFLTKYLCRSSTDFLGPVGERYGGLYFSFMEQFRDAYDMYWFTGDDGCSYQYDPGSNSLNLLSSGKDRKRLSLVRFVASFCFSNLRSRKVCVVSYPYFPYSLLLAVLLFLLKPLRMSIIVDVQDLHRETPGTVSYWMWRTIDELYYLSAHFILNAEECAKLFKTRAWRQSVVIPMAAHDKLITPGAARRDIPMVLGYIGTISKVRGFPDLIEIVGSLRSEGLDLELVINGNNPENLLLAEHPWVRRYERQPFDALCPLLQSFDVGLIPYLDHEYWGQMSITKMATYMSAGLPILILRLTETSNILARWDCGVSADDWGSFRNSIKTLYNDRALRKRLGQNARRAAVEEYNWAKQAERLGHFIENVH